MGEEREERKQVGEKTKVLLRNSEEYDTEPLTLYKFDRLITITLNTLWPKHSTLSIFFVVILFIESSVNFEQVLDDQPRQYWIYANNDNELATVQIKMDCE